MIIIPVIFVIGIIVLVAFLFIYHVIVYSNGKK